jgi:hypothetical protein
MPLAPSSKSQSNLARCQEEMPNSKKVLQSQDRMSEILTATPFAVGLAL